MIDPYDTPVLMTATGIQHDESGLKLDDMLLLMVTMQRRLDQNLVDDRDRQFFCLSLKYMSIVNGDASAIRPKKYTD